MALFIASMEVSLMAVTVNCLCCGHTLDLSDTYDEYEGQLTCWVCHGKLLVRFELGKLLAMTKAEATVVTSVIEVSDDGKLMAITTTDATSATSVIDAITGAR
jgi:hypothetical protein